MQFVKWVLMLVIFHCITASAQATESGHHAIEHHIKAVFLYKFAAYVDWPASAFSQADTPFIIGVIGADKIETELTALSRGNGLKGRSILIKHLSPNDNLDDIHILFIGEKESNNLGPLLNSVRSKPVLTVTESRNALAAGSIINFVSVGDYIRFEISAVSADLNQIKISARLLDVAQKIENGRP